MKSILFNTEMVRDILEGRMTEIRRLVKFLNGFNPKWSGYVLDGAVLYGSNNIPAAKPPYRPGDILYVRETWDFKPNNDLGYIYRADYSGPYEIKWRPSIHMPRDAARIFLRMTDVRVEPLLDFTEEQSRKEGIEPLCFLMNGENVPDNERIWQETGQALHNFIQIGDTSIKPADCEKTKWDFHSWVWVIKFERCEEPE